jgi:hypothetical protein
MPSAPPSKARTTEPLPGSAPDLRAHPHLFPTHHPTRCLRGILFYLSNGIVTQMRPVLQDAAQRFSAE